MFLFDQVYSPMVEVGCLRCHVIPSLERFLSVSSGILKTTQFTTPLVLSFSLNEIA
jgi:hypothetical protein